MKDLCSNCELCDKCLNCKNFYECDLTGLYDECLENNMKYYIEKETDEVDNNYWCVFDETDEVDEEHTRVCSECGCRFSEGYCVDSGMEYYCSDECLHKHYTDEEWEDLYNNGESDSYWTSWVE